MSRSLTLKVQESILQGKNKKKKVDFISEFSVAKFEMNRERHRVQAKILKCQNTTIIQISTGYQPDNNRISTRYQPDTIQILSGYHPDMNNSEIED